MLAACGAFPAQHAQAITLAYKSGETFKYHFHAALNYTVGISTMTIPVTADISADEKITVKSVDPSGTADMTVDLSNLTAKTTSGGMTNTTTKNTPTSLELKVASDGRVINVNGQAISGAGALPGIPGTQGGLISAILPDKPVKPGDTWTKSYDQSVPIGSGTIHVTSNNKYTKDEKVGSVNAAVVQSSIGTNLDLDVNPSAARQAGSSIFPSGAESSGLQSLTLAGTDTATVTSWIDTGAKQILKSHRTDTIDLTLNFIMTPAATGATANPMLTGPVTIKGSQTLDMTPA